MAKKGTAKIDIKPTAGYLIIKPQEAQLKTASGIYLPDSADEKPQIGKVLAVGPSEVLDSGIKKEAPVKVGSTVVYKKWGGNEVKVGGEEYLFAKFEDVLAVVK